MSWINKNTNRISRDIVLCVGQNLKIPLKENTRIINDTKMSKRSGRNINPIITEISNDLFKDFNGNIKELKKNAENIALKLFRNKKVKIIDTNSIATIDKSGIDETFSKGLTRSKANTANRIKNIIENSIYSFTTYEENDLNGILYHHFYSLIRINNNYGIADVIIREFPKDKTMKDKFYYYGINLLNNKTDLSPLTQHNTGGKAFDKSVSKSNLSQKINNVKTFNILKDEKLLNKKRS